MYIGTIRFNNKTYIENYNWRFLKNSDGEKIFSILKGNENYKGCIYALRHRISTVFPPFCNVIVIEMNNDVNQIMGIGYLYNYLRLSRTEKIHENEYQNRYIYKGTKRVDRTELDEEILLLLENMVFKTSGHYKRNRSIINFPLYRMGRQIKKKEKTLNKCPFCIKKYKYIKRLRCHLIKDHVDKDTQEYVKEIERHLPEHNKYKKTIYKCSLCGKCKKNHRCEAITYSDEQRKKICDYLENLFT